MREASPVTAIPRFAIVLVATTALAYEILLMRLFSIIQWHHFAYMIISLALLGYGVSGAFLSIAQRRLLAQYPVAFISNVVLFGVSTVVCYRVAQWLPFNAEEVLWDWRQSLWLLAMYLLLALPFFFAANCTALSIARFRAHVAHVYALDLVGAGVGSCVAVGLLFMVFPNTALQLLGALALLAAATAWWEMSLTPRRVSGGFVVLALLLLAVPAGSLHMSPYKSLAQARQIDGVQVLEERSSPLGLLSVVASPLVPWRYAPGLSLLATQEPPPQRVVFADGEGMTAITDDGGDPTRLAYLDQTTSSLPYHLHAPQQVLVLGAGGGADVLQARYHRTEHIDAVELNPQMISIVRDHYAQLAGRSYDSPDTRLIEAEAREFAASAPGRYDLIQVAMLDSFSAAAAGLYALNESYLYTVEALQSYLAALRPGGYLAITRWVTLPPRDTLKLVATAAAALRHNGVAQPAQHVMLIRSWQTSTLIVKNGAIDAGEIEAARQFCRERGFDVAFYPGMRVEEANRYNILSEPAFFTGTQALTGDDADAFMAAYKFDLRPATDDRPYFFHFFRWPLLEELLALRSQGGMALLEWGYLILAATLVQALLVSVLLILLPIKLLRRRLAQPTHGVSRLRVLSYFFALGLAFLFIEMAFIQKFIQFIHHPVYSAAVVLAAFLVSAGVGSAYSSRFVTFEQAKRALRASVVGIVIFGVAYLLVLSQLFVLLSVLPVMLRGLITIVLIAPLGFCMGMPFPLAMRHVANHAQELIPWAWGVNGCASVVSAVLATLLAIQWGFSVVIVLALALYVAAFFVFPRARAAATAGP